MYYSLKGSSTLLCCNCLTAFVGILAAWAWKRSCRLTRQLKEVERWCRLLLILNLGWSISARKIFERVVIRYYHECLIKANLTKQRYKSRTQVNRIVVVKRKRFVSGIMTYQRTSRRMMEMSIKCERFSNFMLCATSIDPNTFRGSYPGIWKVRQRKEKHYSFLLKHIYTIAERFW